MGVLDVSDSPDTKRRRIASGNQAEQIPHPQATPGYFPLSAEHMFGPLPIPVVNDDASRSLFPSNTTFCTADWVNNEIPADRFGYDVVVACVRNELQ
jgi:7SK snRNA methylphosphate capping enzyme